MLHLNQGVNEIAFFGNTELNLSQRSVQGLITCLANEFPHNAKS